MTKHRHQVTAKDRALFSLNEDHFEIYQAFIRNSIHACNQIEEILKNHILNLNNFADLSDTILLKIASIPYREGRIEFDKVKGCSYIMPPGLNTLNARAKESNALQEFGKRFLLHEFLKIPLQTTQAEESSSCSSRFKKNVYELSIIELDEHLKSTIKGHTRNEIIDYIAEEGEEFHERLRELHGEGFFTKMEYGIRQFNSLLYNTTITLAGALSTEVLFQEEKKELETKVFFKLAEYPLKILAKHQDDSFEITGDEEDTIIYQVFSLVDKHFPYNGKIQELTDLENLVQNDKQGRGRLDLI